MSIERYIYVCVCYEYKGVQLTTLTYLVTILALLRLCVDVVGSM
jgi:hypothetical protein